MDFVGDVMKKYLGDKMKSHNNALSDKENSICHHLETATCEVASVPIADFRVSNTLRRAWYDWMSEGFLIIARDIIGDICTDTILEAD